MSRLKVYNIFISVYCMDRRKAVSLLQQHSYVHIKLKGSITLLKKFGKILFFTTYKNNLFRSFVYCILGDNDIIKANATSMQGVIPFMLITMPPA